MNYEFIEQQIAGVHQYGLVNEREYVYYVRSTGGYTNAEMPKTL
jgi:hypothetical protein